MKAKLIIAGVCMMLVGGGYVFAHEGMEHDEGMEAIDHAKGAMMEQEGMMGQETGEETTTAVEVGNKICPVSGEKVGEMGDIVTYEYNGKIYNLCCNACAKDFKKDPEKYSKIAEEEVAQSRMTEDEEGQEDHSGHDHEHHE